MAAADVLDERVSGADHSCAAELLQAAHGRSRDFTRPWSASLGLFAYCSVTWQAAGTNSPSTLGDQHVDDLPELVDGSVEVDPLAADLEVGLIHEPPIARGVPAGSCRVDQQRREPLHPPDDRDMIHLDTALNEQLLHVAVRQPVPQVQRTATMITSGGNRNPPKPDRGGGTRR